MHRIIQDGLEEYLAGRAPRDLEVHLNNCAECRLELEEFGSVSSLLRQVFETPDVEVAPTGSFYARVAQNVAETVEARKTASPWAFFSIDAAFGRRVAFGSLLALALMGSFLISRESDAVIDLQPGPEALIAQHEPVPPDATVDRDRMMMTLASYER